MTLGLTRGVQTPRAPGNPLGTHPAQGATVGAAVGLLVVSEGHGAAGAGTIAPGAAVTVTVAEGRTRQASVGTGRVVVGTVVAGTGAASVGLVAAGAVAVATGVPAVGAEGAAVCLPGVTAGFGLRIDPGVDPGRAGAAVADLPTPNTATEDPAGRALGGPDAGRAEAGRAVTP